MTTVKEIIEKLSKYDSNAEVIACGGENWSALRVLDKEGLHQIYMHDECDDDEI
jgi:hypothetical protein